LLAFGDLIATEVAPIGEYLQFVGTRPALTMVERCYCWRCGKSVPMLDEVLPFLCEERQQIKQYRESHGAPLPEALPAVQTVRAQV
jgi:hypothetical protein